MRDPRPLVSVITPVFNAQAYIGETIESVLSQTWQNWEMLIVDDGSTDATASVIDSYKGEKRIKYSSLGYNSGRPSVPRNYGMREAGGPYLAFLDSDDLWLPEKLEKQVHFMEEHEDIFMSYTRCTVQANGKATKIRPTVPRQGFIFTPLFLLNNFIPCLTVMLRNDDRHREMYLFDEDPRLKAIEDYDLWLKIAVHEKVGFIDELLAVFRLRGDSIFGSGGLKAYLNRNHLVIQKHRQHVPKTTLLAKYVGFYIQALAMYGLRKMA